MEAKNVKTVVSDGSVMVVVATLAVGVYLLALAEPELSASTEQIAKQRAAQAAQEAYEKADARGGWIVEPPLRGKQLARVEALKVAADKAAAAKASAWLGHVLLVVGCGAAFFLVLDLDDPTKQKMAGGCPPTQSETRNPKSEI